MVGARIAALDARRKEVQAMRQINYRRMRRTERRSTVHSDHGVLGSSCDGDMRSRSWGQHVSHMRDASRFPCSTSREQYQSQCNDMEEEE